MAMTLDDLVGQLREAYGDTLRSIVLYGSAVAGEHMPENRTTTFSSFSITFRTTDSPPLARC
jgi:predicted nucleotidyltransferase